MITEKRAGHLDGNKLRSNNPADGYDLVDFALCQGR